MGQLNFIALKLISVRKKNNKLSLKNIKAFESLSSKAL
jgi:hypothetical protein